MFDFLKGKPDELVGIDIGTKNIKFVHLGKDKDNKAKLINYAFASFGQNNVRKLTNKQVANALKIVLQQAKIEIKQAVMSLPAFASFMTVVQFPGMEKKEINNIVKIEAKKYIPLQLDEVSLGWYFLSQQDVLLVAVPKELTNKYAQIAQLAGLELTGLEGETFSLSRALLDKQGQVLLVDFGASSTNLSLAQQGMVKFNRTISVVADQAYFQIDQVINTIRQLMQKYGKIDKVVISGGADLPNINNSLSQSLQITVEIANPWLHIVYDKKLKNKIEPFLRQLGPYLGVAIGLALRVRT